VSKNFELLQQAEKDQGIAGATPQAAAVTPVGPAVVAVPARVPRTVPAGTVINGTPHRLKLGARTQDEAVKLVQRLFLFSKTDAPRVVVFTAVDHGDGCSSVTSCAAEVLGTESSGSSCVVDGNLRRPALSKFFGIDNRRGLAEALTQSGPIQSFAQQMAGTNLWVLTAGTVDGASHVLLQTDALRARMEELRAEFDHVLVDAPPVNLYADALTLGQLSDGMVLILHAEATRREAARKAKKGIQDAGVRLLGAVLNRRSYPIPQALYDRL
jgi:polysaccharide biosynthesis transport protein